MFDDDSEAEEDQVFLPEELAGLGEGNQSGDDELNGEFSADEATIVAVARGRRRRYCLEGCDCERPRGRLCECEKRGDGMCGDQCQCDPAKCRSIAHGGTSEVSSEEECENYED